MATSQRVEVTYGSFRFGGVTAGRGAKILGRFAHLPEYGKVAVRFRALVYGATEAAFLTAEAAMLAAVTTRDQDLVVQLGGANRWPYQPSTRTALDTRGTARKTASAWDTNRSAVYEVEFLADLPSEGAGENGLGAFDLGYDHEESGRRTATITGTYSSVSAAVSGGPRLAPEQYAAEITNAVSGLLTGDWELTGESTKRSRTGHALDFSRVYEEVLWSDSAAGGDNAAVVGLRLRVQIADSSEPAASREAAPPAALSASFSCSVRFDQSTDLVDTWASTVLPHLRAEIAARVGAGLLVYMKSVPAFEPRSNRISGVLEGFVYRSSLIALRVRTRNTVRTGYVLSPRADGEPFSYDVDEGFPTWVRTVRQSSVRRAGGGGGSVADGGQLGLGSLSGSVGSSDEAPAAGVPQVTSIPTPQGFVRVFDDDDSEGVSLGLPGSRVDLELREEVAVFQRVVGVVAEQSGAALLGIL